MPRPLKGRARPRNLPAVSKATIRRWLFLPVYRDVRQEYLGPVPFPDRGYGRISSSAIGVRITPGQTALIRIPFAE